MGNRDSESAKKGRKENKRNAGKGRGKHMPGRFSTTPKKKGIQKSREQHEKEAQAKTLTKQRPSREKCKRKAIATGQVGEGIGEGEVLRPG